MSRLAWLVRIAAALVMSGAVSLLSCFGASAVIGTSSGGSVLRFVTPFLIGAMVGGWAFYLLMVGERPDLKSRRAKRVARTRPQPRPSIVAATCLALVLGAVAVWSITIWRVSDPSVRLWVQLIIVMAVGLALLLGVPLALFVGIGAAVARKRSRQEATRDETRAPS